VDVLGWLAPEQPVLAEPLATAVRLSDGSAAIELEAAARAYGDGDGAGLATGLPRISTAFRRGGFHVVAGPSGSGKTTLLRLVTGLDRPTEGRVITLGADLATLDRDELAVFRARRIGLVDQVRDLVPFLSARENVELGLAIRGQDGPDNRDRAMAALARFGLADHGDRAPDGLSAGERLRVALARAMASQPELLVLDEPTAALDRAGARAVAELLAGLDDGAVTILASTHDPALIAAASDRLDLGAHRIAAHLAAERQHDASTAAAASRG
jgi:putative ABC transport system ATP-binding protein